MNHRKITRYVTARDGTRIAWHTHLEIGPTETNRDERALAERPTLLLTNGIGTTENFWRHLVHVFAREYRVVHWDYRGHGQSERAVGNDYSIPTHADDLLRVTDAVMALSSHPAPPVHLGFSMGVTVLLEAYRRRPERMSSLVLVAGGADAPFSTVWPFRLPGVLPTVRALLAALTPLVPVAAPAVRYLLTSPVAYPAGRALGLLRPRAPREDIDHFLRGLCAMDPRAFWLCLRGLMAAHASDVLPTVKVPTLIVAASHDLLVPMSQMRALRAGIPHAQWVVVHDAGHANLIEAGPEIAAHIRLFLREIDSRRER